MCNTERPRAVFGAEASGARSAAVGLLIGPIDLLEDEWAGHLLEFGRADTLLVPVAAQVFPFDRHRPRVRGNIVREIAGEVAEEHGALALRIESAPDPDYS